MSTLYYDKKDIVNMDACVEIWKNDKSFIHLPRHSSFTINHTFVNPSKTGHNMAEKHANTTVSTTKAHRQNGDKGTCFGSIP